MPRKWLLLSSLALGAALVVLLFPYSLSIYQLEVGGRALDETLGEIDPLEWWYIGPREVRDPQSLQKAITHLQKANRLSHAWRLLGRAQVAQGDLLAGIEALKQFTTLRPDNPMGHLELAAAYQLADRRLHEMRYTNLLDALAGARISAPDVEGEVSYQPERWRSEYAYLTTFDLPADDERSTLFLHAGSWVTFTVALTQPSVLRFGMALDPRSLNWGGDGATFEVFVDGTRVFLEHLPVETAQEGWQEREVYLGEYTGQTVGLTLTTTPGPKGEDTADWAGWGTPRIEAPEAAAYWQAVMGEPWLAEWRVAGVRAGSFIGLGEAAREAERYEEALGWYGQATRLEPSLGDPWYYVGLAYEDQQQWLRALQAYERAIATGHFRQAHDSSPHYRTGVIYESRLDPGQPRKALAAYERAVEEDDFSDDREAADCHHRKGAILRRQKGDPNEYIAEFRRAIELDPGHAEAHLLLGLAYYARDQDAVKAKAQIMKALALAPNSKWPPYHLGEIYRQEGGIGEAEAMYKRALEIDPDFETAQKGLAKLREGE